MKLFVNGDKHEVDIRNSDTLLYIVRNKLGLTGSKPGCLNGDCGACTVLVDGEVMKSCLVLAIEAEGKEITTIEKLENTPVQRAFIEHFAFQCGYCTPGFIINAQALVEKHPEADNYTVKKWLESNICRCTGYEEITKAITSLLEKRN